LKRPWPAPEIQDALECFAEDDALVKTVLVPNTLSPLHNPHPMISKVLIRFLFCSYGPSGLFLWYGSLSNWSMTPQEIFKINAEATLMIRGDGDYATVPAMSDFF